MLIFSRIDLKMGRSAVRSLFIVPKTLNTGKSASVFFRLPLPGRLNSTMGVLYRAGDVFYH